MSLVKKLLLWFSAGVAVVLLLFLVSLSTQLGGNTRRAISGSMEEMKSYCSTVLLRAISEGDYSADESGFKRVANDVAGNLNLMLGNGIACYTMDGELICSTFDTDMAEERGAEDLAHAMKGESAYTVVEIRDDMHVYLSFPVESQTEYIGIMRMQSDYSGLAANNTNVKTSLIMIVAAMLIVLGMTLAVFMTNVVKPVKKLSDEIERMTVRPEQARPLPVRRHDEIGRLTLSYNKMADALRMQMNALWSERDRLTGTLAYKKAFYDNLTHELKTPITIIRGYAEMMESTDFEDKEFARKGAEQIITESRRLTDMVAALLENSRRENEDRQLTDVDLAEIISAVTASMSIKAHRYGASIDTRLCEAHITGDAERLRQLLVNLIDNAIKYGKTSETVLVTMEKDAAHIRICVINSTDKGEYFANTDKIFLPFYRSRNERNREQGSVGLGLSICRSVAEEHGGTISAEKTGNTVRLTVELPANGGANDE